MGERQFGPYRLVRQIAVGGMAEIHLAKTAGIAVADEHRRACAFTRCEPSVDLAPTSEAATRS